MNLVRSAKIETKDLAALVIVAAVGVTAFAVAYSPRDFLLFAGSLAAYIVALRLSPRASLWILGFIFPFQGLRISIPAVQGQSFVRFFPDGVDLPIGYAIAILLILALLTRWFLSLAGHRLPRPSLPLVGAAALFWASAALSCLNSGEDLLLSLKFAVYPIAFSYVAFVLLPSEIIKTKDETLALVRGMVTAGAIVAVMGALSLSVGDQVGPWRVTPLQIFGVWPIGSNHNLLAETLVATVPLALLLSEMRRGRERFLRRVLAGSMTLVALLTFARTAWIAFAVMGAVAVALEYREALRKRLKTVALVSLLAVPLVAAFVLTSSTRAVGGSTASRVALTEFSLYLFSSHPLIGVGAGTFVSRLGQAQDFIQDFGDPIDAHGFGQKILAEQGIVGIVFFLFLLGRILQTLFGAVRTLEPGSDGRRTVLFLSLGALGLIVYEVFNTTYYSPKLWLPIGVALAAIPVWTKEKVPII